MRRLLVLIASVMLFTATAHAELREVQLAIFGMD